MVFTLFLFPTFKYSLTQMLSRYSKETRILVAIDCIIFGFDGNDIKLLLVKRGLEPEKGKWSLMGGFVRPDEDLATDLQIHRGLPT